MRRCAYFEPRFGRDFSGVRVHTDSRAAASARRLNARAYTLGQDVVFDAGQFAPETQEGRRLLAHELAHVVQQTREDSTGSAGGCHGKCEGPANSPNAAERHIRVQRRMNAACHDDLGREVHIGRESLINTIIGAHWKGLDTAHNRAEFTIPRSGQNSGTGRADLVAVHPSQIQVYEVKPQGGVDAEARYQLQRYILAGQLYCETLARWVLGNSFPPIIFYVPGSSTF